MVEPARETVVGLGARAEAHLQQSDRRRPRDGKRQGRQHARRSRAPRRKHRGPRRAKKAYRNSFFPAFSNEVDKVTKTFGPRKWLDDDAEEAGHSYLELICKKMSGLKPRMDVAGGLRALDSYKSCMHDQQRWSYAQILAQGYGGSVPRPLLAWNSCVPLPARDFRVCVEQLTSR